MPAAVAAAVSGLLIFRVARQGLRGADAIEYAEHLVRLRTLIGLRDGLWREPRALLEFADRQFPAALHAITTAMGAVIGHDAEAAVLSMIVWYVLLAVGVGTLVAAVVGRRSGSAAACACLLLPALHGSALRYYYDLPMTALLWMAVAVLVAIGPRRPLLGGLAGGLLLAAAATTKWTAVPFGAALVAAGAVPLLALGWRYDKGKGVARAAGSGLLAVGVCGGLIWGYLQLTPESLGWMMGTFHDEGISDQRPLSSIVDKTLALLTSERAHDLELASKWYREHLVPSVLSKAVAYACVPLAAVWLLRSGRLVLFVVIAAGGQLLFLVALVPVQDERFLITALPCVAVVAGLGWGRLPRLLRGVAAVALIAVGLGVAVDFHVPGAADGRVDSDEWGLHSAVWRYGWARADEQPPNPSRGRRALVAAVRECPVEDFFRYPWGDPEELPSAEVERAARDCILAVFDREAAGDATVGPELVQACRQGYWMTYRRLLAEVRGDPDLRGWVVLERQAPAGDPCPPRCPGPRPATEKLCDSAEAWQELHRPGQ